MGGRPFFCFLVAGYFFAIAIVQAWPSLPTPPLALWQAGRPAHQPLFAILAFAFFMASLPGSGAGARTPRVPAYAGFFFVPGFLAMCCVGVSASATDERDTL